MAQQSKDRKGYTVKNSICIPVLPSDNYCQQFLAQSHRYFIPTKSNSQIMYIFPFFFFYSNGNILYILYCTCFYSYYIQEITPNQYIKILLILFVVGYFIITRMHQNLLSQPHIGRCLDVCILLNLWHRKQCLYLRHFAHM